MIRTILIDDEKYALDALYDALSAYESIEVAARFTNPSDAIRYCEMEQIDAVFLDVVMPGMRGLEVAERLRHGKGSEDIIFVTAHQKYEMDVSVVAPLGYLTKPVSSRHLDRVIHKLQVKHNV